MPFRAFVRMQNTPFKRLLAIPLYLPQRVAKFFYFKALLETPALIAHQRPNSR